MLLRRTLLVGLVALVAACGPQARDDAPQTIAIATLMSHPALDEVRVGIVEGLRESGLEEGRDYRIVDRNANADDQLTVAIAGELAAQQPDVIVAIATPMAQAIKARWNGPLVFAAVTDPVGAGLVANLEGVENVTGTSDAWPYRAQLELIRRIQPNARRLGVLLNPGEAASSYGIGEIRRLAPEFNFEISEFAVSNTNEVASAARLAAQRADALFLSSDNTVIAGVQAAYAAAIQARKPLYVGDSGTVERGGLAAVSVGYRQLGVETGRLTARMLRGERTIPVSVASGDDIYLNTRAAQQMGVTIPPDVVEDAHRVFDQIAQ